MTYIPRRLRHFVVQYLSPSQPLSLSVSSFTNWKLDELVLIHVRKWGGIRRQTDGIRLLVNL